MSERRTTQEVLDSHLDCRQRGDLEGDLRHNYSPDVVIITMEGIFRGHEGVRENASRLRFYYPDANFDFPRKRVADRFAFIEWRARTTSKQTCDGADSFVVEEGRIVCQTIRYTVSPGAGGTAGSGSRH